MFSQSISSAPLSCRTCARKCARRAGVVTPWAISSASPCSNAADVGWPRPRRNPTNHVNGARHAILLAEHLFRLGERKLERDVCGVACPAVGDQPVRLLELFHGRLGLGPYSPSTSSGGSAPSMLSAVCSHFARTGSNMAVAAAAGANLSSTSGNSCLPTCAKMGRRSRALLLDRLHCRHSSADGLLDLRGHVDEPKDDRQEANKLFHGAS